MIRYEKLDGPFGRSVYGLDLTDHISDGKLQTLTKALYDHRVLILKNQACTIDQYLKFGRLWGTPIQHVVDTSRMPDYPDLLSVGNLPDKDDVSRNSAAFWHTDQAYESDVATATMLYARKVPTTGGETRIADTKAAYDDLDSSIKKNIENLTAVHFYGSTSGRDGERKTRELTDAQAARVPPVLHPLVRPHTITGEQALYAVSGTAFAIDGMKEGEANSLFAELKAHCLQDKYLYSHKYEVGDIAIWDTQMTLHCATPIGAPTDTDSERLLWRISVRGKPAIYE